MQDQEQDQEQEQELLAASSITIAVPSIQVTNVQKGFFVPQGSPWIKSIIGPAMFSVLEESQVAYASLEFYDAEEETCYQEMMSERRYLDHLKKSWLLLSALSVYLIVFDVLLISKEIKWIVVGLHSVPLVTVPLPLVFWFTCEATSHSQTQSGLFLSSLLFSALFLVVIPDAYLLSTDVPSYYYHSKLIYQLILVFMYSCLNFDVKFTSRSCILFTLVREVVFVFAAPGKYSFHDLMYNLLENVALLMSNYQINLVRRATFHILWKNVDDPLHENAKQLISSRRVRDGNAECLGERQTRFPKVSWKRRAVNSMRRHFLASKTGMSESFRPFSLEKANSHLIKVTFLIMVEAILMSIPDVGKNKWIQVSNIMWYLPSALLVGVLTMVYSWGYSQLKVTETFIEGWRVSSIKWVILVSISLQAMLMVLLGLLEEIESTPPHSDSQKHFYNVVGNIGLVLVSMSSLIGFPYRFACALIVINLLTVFSGQLYIVLTVAHGASLNSLAWFLLHILTGVAVATVSRHQENNLQKLFRASHRLSVTLSFESFRSSFSDLHSPLHSSLSNDNLEGATAPLQSGVPSKEKIQLSRVLTPPVRSCNENCHPFTRSISNYNGTNTMSEGKSNFLNVERHIRSKSTK
jgi:hypothetical protein